MVRSTDILAALLSLVLTSACVSELTAQTKKGAEFIPGTVVSIEKEKTGRNYKMKIKSTADETEFDVPIKPATQFAVTTTGDEGFLRPNVVIMTSAVTGTSPNLYTAKDFTVYLGAAPQPHLTPDPKASGVFELCGKVLAKEADGLTVQCGPQPRKILFEGAITVSVKISDPGLIKEGDAVEVEGILIKTKKQINASTINVTSAEPINSDEYFASLEERKKGKSSKTKSAKTKTEGGETEADPFGVLKGKKTTKSKTDKTDEADAKKDAEMSDEAKPTVKDKKPAA